MVFEYGLSSITCPKCYKNNGNIQVIGVHLFSVDGDKLPLYDIICYSCHKVFTKQAILSIKEI